LKHDMNLLRKVFYTSISVFLFTACAMDQMADLVLINGKVYTVDAHNAVVQAVAVIDGKILFAGSSEQVRAYIGNKTQVIDLAGRLVTPGIIEGHGHFMGMGYSLMTLDLQGTTSYEEVIKRVEKAVEDAVPGEWIIGRGWHQSKWDSISGEVVKGFPNNHMLTAASPDNPVVLRHASGHAMIVNTKAMEMAGINSNTKDIEGGEIIRDQNGNPTGIFVENAMGFIGRYIPEPTEESDRKAFKMASRNCLENGITSFHDAGEDEEMIQLFKKILKEEGFSTRLYVMLSGDDRALLEKYYQTGPEIGLGDNFLTIRSVKLFIDGALGSRGAWLMEPYTDMPGHFGHAVTELSYLEEVCKDAIHHGFQVCTHAIGDRGNKEVLDIYEELFRENPDKEDPRFRIEHAQHLRESDIPRFARLGEDRIIEGAYVWQKLLQQGTRIVNGTDVPVEPLSPIQCFYASVARKTLEGMPPGGYEPDQRMSREEALRSYTVDAAYGAFEENIKGSIEAGKLADLTVFSKDIMTIPEDEILNADVDMTIVNGNVLFERK
jgi:predicted amidohydrolase YtcJ